MNPDQLLELAQELARREQGYPRQSSLKRALSTAYYALFHAIAYECVAQTIGWGFKSDRYWQIVTPLYRAFDHRTATQLFLRLRNDSATSVELKQVGRAFIELQEARIAADYDPSARFTRTRTLQLLEQASVAVQLLKALLAEERRFLAIQLITKPRWGDRPNP